MGWTCRIAPSRCSIPKSAAPGGGGVFADERISHMVIAQVKKESRDPGSRLSCWDRFASLSYLLNIPAR
jgi:hypothetical protein